MHVLKSISVLFILLFAVNSFPADTFEFFPQNYTAHLEKDHIWFVDKSTNAQTGPELYADNTEPDFFVLIKNQIKNALKEDKTLNLHFENVDSENHGQYNCIIPDF